MYQRAWADVTCTFTDEHARLKTGVFLHIGLYKYSCYNPCDKGQLPAVRGLCPVMWALGL